MLYLDPTQLIAHTHTHTHTLFMTLLEKGSREGGREGEWDGGRARERKDVQAAVWRPFYGLLLRIPFTLVINQYIYRWYTYTI